MTTSTIIDTIRPLRLVELGHPEEVAKLVPTKSGVILISGRQGSGKSVTLSTFAQEIIDTDERKVLEIVAEADSEDLGVEIFVISDRPYQKMTKNPKPEAIEAARRYSLITAAEILNAGTEVAVFDDIRHAEAGLIASHLAEAGVLVVASIHNSGPVANAVDRFIALSGKISSTPVDAATVRGVIHQELKRDGANAVLSSSVHVK
jgi:Tfp pilus assembly pilus retraction ATPase PilT